MTDKSATERDVVSTELPGAKKLICLFHALQIFQREVTPAKLNITTEQSKCSLQYLNKLAHSKSEAYYNATLNEMKENIPQAVVTYFSKNWEQIKHEWAKCFTKYTTNFFNFTNNRLESLNSKLKSVISTYSTFDEFIEKLFIFVNIKRTEQKNEYSKMVLKVPSKDLSTTNVMFYNHLTYYAYKNIAKDLVEVQLSTSIPYTFNSDDLTTIRCITKNEMFVISETTCQCSFFISMHLPCKHILYYRKYLGHELFCDSLFNSRWTR
ncbi:unnamed protein product [Psylliodes chrysocephalus]|uniref:SWIM-type domain-containing protein n=1 Tax=Psylliodes chrysocephalus TaxID=3402493 RepID=A0A9P0GLS3_9CUCU|nr:unnamed protein product [Psylliodes chrysocephala]